MLSVALLVTHSYFCVCIIVYLITQIGSFQKASELSHSCKTSSSLSQSHGVKVCLKYSMCTLYDIVQIFASYYRSAEHQLSYHNCGIILIFASLAVVVK